MYAMAHKCATASNSKACRTVRDQAKVSAGFGKMADFHWPYIHEMSAAMWVSRTEWLGSHAGSNA